MLAVLGVATRPAFAAGGATVKPYIVLVLDVSGSMQDNMETAQKAACGFVDTLRDTDRAMLVDRAFRLTRDNAAHKYSDADLPLLMAQASNAASDRSLREVSLG